MNNTTRIGAVVSAQIVRMGQIEFTDGRFRLQDNAPFNIKVDGDEPVSLEVSLSHMAEGDYIETTFEPGWNPEVVREVKEPSGTADLKYGY